MTTVTGTYLLPGDGDTAYATGYIRFVLQPAAIDVLGNQRTCTPVYAVLENGSFAIDLVPDDELVNVADGTAVYEVTEYIDGCRRGPWYLVLTDDTPVDLPSRYPGDSAGTTAVLPVPGPQGEKGDTGDTGPTGPEGPAGEDGLSAYPLPQVATWSALPVATAGLVGARYQVMDGLGWLVAVCVADPTPAWSIADDSDTGWHTVAPINGWVLDPGGTNRLMVRRRGSRVMLAMRRLYGDSATSDTFWSAPTSFTPDASPGGLAMFAVDSGSAPLLFRVQTTGACLLPRPARTYIASATVVEWQTARDWPTAAPV